MTDETFLRIEEVTRRTGVGRTEIYDRMARGDFPQRIKLSRRLAVWRESEVSAWIEAKIAEHEAATAPLKPEKRKRGRPRKALESENAAAR